MVWSSNDEKAGGRGGGSRTEDVGFSKDVMRLNKIRNEHIRGMAHVGHFWNTAREVWPCSEEG